MDSRVAALLDTRGLLRVGGPDARDFLQGMISNDVHKLAPERALWSAFLTPQGKFLHEFFLTADPGDDSAILLDCEADRRADLKRRLSIYKLRSKVTIDDASEDFSVAVLFGGDTLSALSLPAEPGTPVMRDGKDVGTLRSSANGMGLALLRLEALDGELTAGEATLTPRKPDWAKF